MSMTKIATVTVPSGGQAAIEFLSIPQTFTDLWVVASTRGNGGASNRNMNIRVNSSTTGYSERMLDSNGSSASSASTSGSLINWAASNDSAATANTFSNVSIYIPNYAGTSNKSFSIDASTENNATANINRITAALWSNGAAITSISLLPESGVSWVQYSSATLYGITKGSLAGVTVS